MNSSHTSLPHVRPLFMVDDDDGDRRLFMRLVTQSKVTNPAAVFAKAEDLIDGLIAVLRGAPPPLACFVDMRMPGMSGLDVLRWIRCQHALDGIPVIMLSSSEEARDLHDAHHDGAQCYLAKFPTPEQFCEIVKEAERVAAASPDNAFKLGSNLLLGSTQAVA